MNDITRDDFNGLGGRLSMVERHIAETRVKAARNEQDIQKMFDGIKDMTESGAATYKQIQCENAKNSKDLLTRIVFVFIGGIAIMILKDLIIKG